LDKRKGKLYKKIKIKNKKKETQPNGYADQEIYYGAAK